MFTDPYGNAQTFGCLANEGNGKSLSAGTLIIRLAKGKMKGLEAKRGNSPTLTQERLRQCQGEVRKGEFSNVFIWILAYRNSVCVSSLLEGLSGNADTWKLLCGLVSVGHVLDVDTWQGLGTSLLQGRMLLGRHCIYGRQIQWAPVWGSSSCLCKKSTREAHLTWRPKRCTTAPTKWVSWWLSSKMLWPAGFPRLHRSLLWSGSPKAEPPGVSAQLCLRTGLQQSSNPAFAVSHGKQVPTLLAFVLQ